MSSSSDTADARPEKADTAPKLPAPPQSHRFFGAWAFAAAVLVAFGWPLFSLFVHALASDLHSHIVLVPFVTAYLIHIHKDSQPPTGERSPGPALLCGVAGSVALGFYWALAAGGGALSQNDSLALLAFAFVCFTWTGGFLFLGRKWMAAAAFPVAFLIFLVPLPDSMVDLLEQASVVGSAEAAYLMFEFTGTLILRDGVVFQIPGITLRVAQECSGIRSSWVLFITSLVAAHLFLKSPWRRFLLVTFIIPLGIVRNGFRILVLGLLCVHISPEMIHSFVHKRGGPIFFALSLIPLFLLLWWLRLREFKQASKLRVHSKL